MSATWKVRPPHPDKVTTKAKPPKSKPNNPPKHNLFGQKTHIVFYGQDFFTPAKNYTFSVLCGDQPPRIVGGYAEWQKIKRPLRRSLTIFQGYDPVSMVVNIRFIKFDAFGSRLSTDAAGLEIEKEIEVLEWMAGESIDVGPSPFLFLSTFDGNGNTIPLIPFEYQSASASVPKIFGGGDTNPWIVDGGIVWDEEPERNENGYRIHQKASLTLTFYQGPAGASPGGRGKARPKATVFVSRPGADTPLLIARREPTANAPLLARAIIRAPQNKHLHLRGANQKIKHGKKVTVPSGG